LGIKRVAEQKRAGGSKRGSGKQERAIGELQGKKNGLRRTDWQRRDRQKGQRSGKKAGDEIRKRRLGLKPSKKSSEVGNRKQRKAKGGGTERQKEVK